jgi:DNA adenine methylase
MTRPNKPVISYYGGKQRLASKLAPLIPKHTVYVEPFAGGAALLLKKPRPEVTNQVHYREVINDADGRLINFYRQLRDNGEELIRRIQLTLYSEEEHKIALRDGLDHPCPLEAARRYYVNIQQSFSNRLNGGWKRSVFGCNHAAGWVNKLERLPEYLDRMVAVYIANTDALNCIQQWDSPQSFFYCDPPYPGADQGHYKGYTVEDFAQLVEVLDGIQGAFLLSCYDVPEVTIPPDWERFEFGAQMSAAKPTKRAEDLSCVRKNPERTEVVYRRHRKGQLRKKIQELFASGKFDCFTGDGDGD